MMATAFKKVQKVAVSEKEWVKIFPKDLIENYTGSLTFIKQLTLVAVSMITYIKSAFPEESYTTEKFAGIPLKILNSRCSDDLAQFVSTALQQAWEAFNKKYVHQLALCFYENEIQPENLLEYHIFEYTYNADGVSFNIHSKSRNSEKQTFRLSLDSVKTKTLMMIRSLYIFMTQTGLPELPLNYDVCLRLYYNDGMRRILSKIDKLDSIGLLEEAPDGYQAPGFCSTEGPDHLEPTLQELLRLGSLETPFHRMNFGCYSRGLFPTRIEALPSENAPVITQGDNLGSRSRIKSEKSESSVEINMRCPCNRVDVPTDQTTIITCRYCLTQQHAACFGFLSHAPKAHCCAVCYDEDEQRKCSDPKLVAYDRKRRECLSICRRTLEFCSQVGEVSAHTLMDRFALSADTGCKMIRVLQTHNVVPPTGEYDVSTPRKINQIRLKLAFKSFFYAEEMEEDTIVERLMAETKANHETSDPIGETLSPLEKITLRNSSNLGQIIENPAVSTKRTAREDKTLQQYREAVLANDDITEELPLSGSHNPVKDIANIGRKKSKKRINDDDDEWVPKLQRSGAKTKKARTSK